MKKFLLITTALLLSLSAWTQDLDYYRTIYTKSEDFKVIDIKGKPDGSVYLLIQFKGTHTIPIANFEIESPANKYAFCVVHHEKEGGCYSKVKVMAMSLKESTCEVSDLHFINTSQSLCVMGNKSSGTLKVTGSQYFSGDINSTSDAQGLFLAHFRLKALDYCYYKDYLATRLEVYPVSGDANIGDLISYPYSGNPETDDYFIFGGSLAGTLEVGSHTLDVGNQKTPFVAKVNIYGNVSSNPDLNYAVNFVKKLDVTSSSSDYYNEISSIAVNNQDIVIAGCFTGTSLNVNPANSTEKLIASDPNYTQNFIARYSRSSFVYKGAYKIDGHHWYNFDITSDANNNFYVSFSSWKSGVYADFKSGNSAFVSRKTFVGKYSPTLDYQWHITTNGGSSFCPKIGVNNENELCVLAVFYGTHNFNPNGTPINYTSEVWTTVYNPNNLFLGRYNSSDGTLVTGNVLKITSEAGDFYRDFNLASHLESNTLTISTFTNKVDYDLGIGEEVVSYPNNTYFIASYNICDKTIVGDNLDKTICEGEELLSTSVSAIGTGATSEMQYRWFKDGAPLQNGTFDEGLITHADENQLKINNITPEASGNYKLEVTSRCDIPRFSNEATFTVTPITHITQEPSGQIVCEGASASFSVNADNNPTYQWQVNDGSGGFVNMSGKTSATLNLNDVDLNMAGYQYRCKVTGQSSCNEVYSNTVNLGVKATPQIQAQPQANTETCEGTPATISVVTDGAGLSYQWQVSTNNGSSFSNISNGANYSGTQNATLEINNPTLAYNDRIYRCVVSGECGSSVTSNEASLSVQKAVQLVSNPQSKNICQYEETTFNVNAEGDGLQYAWQINTGSGWVNLNNDNTYSNVANPSLSLHSVGINMNGYQYRCKILSPCSTPVYSNVANLNVTAIPVVSLSSSEGLDICEGNTTTLSSNIGAGSYTYQWKRNFSTVSGASNSTLTANQSGAYTLYVEENVSGCTFESDPIMLNVHALPNNTITLNGSNQLCEGESRQLTAPAGNGYTYQWYQNNNPMSGQTSHSLFVNASGAYHAKIVSDYACENTSSDELITVNANPTVDLTTDDAEICEGEQTSINATSNSAYNYQWKRNGNNVTGETANALQVSQAGVYSVEVVNSSTNCSAVSDPLTVSVHALPNNNITIVGNNAFCEGLSAELTVPAGNGYTYQWYQNDNPITGETANSLIVSQAGAYKAKIINAYGCENISAIESITINPNPVVSLITDDAEICEGEQTLIEATSDANYTYQWKRNGSALTGETANTLQANQAGVYNVAVVNTVTNCSASSEGLSINVHSAPNNSITVLGEATFCEGLSTQLSIQAGSNCTFEWYKDNILINNQTSHSLFVSESGTYHAEITSAYGCENTSASETITVLPNPSVSLTSPDAELCEGETATINATSNENYTYQWKRNGMVLIGEASEQLQTEQAGVYSVEVLDATSSCTAVSDPLSVSVHALPNNNITLIGSSTFCEGLSVELTVPAGNGYAYEWYKDNTPITGQTSNSLTVTESGAYHAQINDAYGCQNTSLDEIITVSPSPELSLIVANSEICQGTETTISTEENSDYFYQWLHNNNEMPGETSYSVQVSEAGLYKVSVINTATGCSGLSDYTVISVNPLPTPELSVSGTLTVCVEDSVELSLNESYSQYLWQDQSNNDNLYISESGVYSVTVTDENNCQNSAEIEINEILVPTPDICMVTVDTAINRNLIIWENVPNTRGIASYNVYKLAANSYQLLGNVQYGDTTEFVDMTSEPHIHSDKYVIASVDSCGNVGEYSPYHQTMNLSIVNGAGDDADNGVVLIWTKYIDESGFNNPTEYEIYRGVDELTYHASVTGGLSDYNYNIPDTEEGEHFLIVVQRPSGCFPLNGVNELKANGGPYYNSVSNMEDEGLLISGIKNTESSLFRIYPNPAKDRISIESDNHIERIRILDISGKVLLEQKANAEMEYSLDLSTFAKGLYFIEVNGQKAKLIKE